MLKIGDSLFHYATLKGSLEYKIYEIINTSEATFYCAQCEDCDHKPMCKILLGKQDDPHNREKKRYKFINMIGNYDETDEYYFWHNSDYYFLTRIDCLIFKAEEVVKNKYYKLEDAKGNLDRLQKEYFEIKKYLDELRNEINA